MSNSFTPQQLTGWAVIVVSIGVSSYAGYRYYDRNTPHVKLANVQFFETGKGIPIIYERSYTDRFPERRTRFINWELDVTFDKEISTAVPFPLEVVWHGPNGSELPNDTPSFSIATDEVSQVFTSGWGAPAIGVFRPGHYTVDFMLDKKLLAEKSFDVFPQTAWQALGARVKSLQFFEGGPSAPSLGFRVFRSNFGALTRSLYWQLELEYPLQQQRTDFVVHADLYGPATTSIGAFNLPNRLSSVDVSTYALEGWRSNTLTQALPDPGTPFQQGTYHLYLSVDGKNISSSEFGVGPWLN